MTRPWPVTAKGCWWTVCGREASRRNGPAFFSGRRRWPPAPISGDGFTRTMQDAEFRLHYLAELELNASVPALEGLVKEGAVTLVFANADLEHNHAAVLRDFLIDRMSAAGSTESGPTGGGQ